MNRLPSGTIHAPSIRKPNFRRRGRTQRVHPSSHSAILPSRIVYIRSCETSSTRTPYGAPCRGFMKTAVPHSSIQGLRTRSRLGGLTYLQGPARQAPPAAVRLGAPFHKEDRAIPEYDRANCGHGALREFVLG